MKTHVVFLADDDVAAGAHRAGNHRPAVFRRFDRAFARHPDAAAEMLFGLREVVMRVDPLQLQVLLMAVRAVRGEADFRQHAVHHLVAIVQRELLRPDQIAEVRGKCGMLLGKVSEITIGQLDVHFPAQILRDPDVVVADPVADAA